MQVAGNVISIDNGKPGGKQRPTDATALRVRVDAECLQVPDRFIWESPLQSTA